MICMYEGRMATVNQLDNTIAEMKERLRLSPVNLDEPTMDICERWLDAVIGGYEDVMSLSAYKPIQSNWWLHSTKLHGISDALRYENISQYVLTVTTIRNDRLSLGAECSGMKPDSFEHLIWANPILTRQLLYFVGEVFRNNYEGITSLCSFIIDGILRTTEQIATSMQDTELEHRPIWDEIGAHSDIEYDLVLATAWGDITPTGSLVI